MAKSKASENPTSLENQGQPARTDIVDMGGEIISIKSPIFISKGRYDIVKEICQVTGENLEQYIRQALYEKVELDLNSPNVIGQLFTERILSIWNTDKEHKDYRDLQSNCGT